MKSINKFYSLPEILISEIYHYDNTYHNVFNKLNFKKELENMYIKLQTKRCKKEVISYVSCLINDESKWYNDYGYIGNDLSSNITQNRIKYKNKDDFDIYIDPPKNGILYFKILPKGHNEKSIISKNQYLFDGFFCHKNKYNDENDLSNDDIKYLYDITPNKLNGPGWVGNPANGFYYDPYLYNDICMWG
jgi:hypothetical protein